MLESIKQMFLELDKNNIKYCHWKSNEHLDASLLGDTDLDILFLSEQRNEIDRILTTCGLKRFRATELMQYNAIEDFIGLDSESGKIWHLHAHHKLTFGQKHLKGHTMTELGNNILKNRIRNSDGIYTSSYEDELILFFVRNALKLRWRDLFFKIYQDDILELKWLLKYFNYNKLKLTSREYFNDEISNIIILLSNQEIDKKIQFYRLHRLLKKDLQLFTGYSTLTSWVVRSKREIYWGIGGIKRRLCLNASKPYRRVSPSGGCVVVFLGSDGAGKSTTIKNVQREFGKKIDVKTVYLGSGDGSSSLFRKPMKWVAKKIGGKGLGQKLEKENYKKNTKSSVKAKLYSCAKIIWAITLAQEKKKKLKIITRSRNNGMLVLVDRYPQTEIMGYNDGPLLSKFLLKGHGILYLIAKRELDIYKSAYMNKPDLTFKLVIPSELAIARKPEMTIAEIEDKKNAVMKMHPCDRIVNIDTSVDIKKSLKIVMDNIWKII